MKHITANLIVEAIEPCLRFWVDRLGFEKSVEVPEGDALGFVILKKGTVELMLQTRASVAKDVPRAADGPFRSALYIDVDSLEPIRRALQDVERVVPDRTTFYGANEVLVRDPAGNLVVFAEHT